MQTNKHKFEKIKPFFLRNRYNIIRHFMILSIHERAYFSTNACTISLILQYKNLWTSIGFPYQTLEVGKNIYATGSQEISVGKVIRFFFIKFFFHKNLYLKAQIQFQVINSDICDWSSYVSYKKQPCPISDKKSKVLKLTTVKL